MKKLILFTSLLVALMFLHLRVNSQITGPNEVCLNSTAYYQNVGDVIVWSVTGGNALVHNPDDKAQILWTHVGVYNVRAIFLDGEMHLDTLVYSVTVHALPTPEIVPLNSNSCITITPAEEAEDPRRAGEDALCYTVCDSGWYYYYADGNVGSTYEWSTSANGEIVEINAITDSVKVRWTGEGYTTLILTEITADGCVSQTEICIKVIPGPGACVTSAPADTNGVIKLCLGANLSLNSNCSQSNSGTGIVNRTWIMGDGHTYTNEQFVDHVYSNPGTYTVTLIIESNCACADTLYRTVIVDSSAGPDIYCVNTVCHNTTSILTTSSECPSLVWGVIGEDSSHVDNDSIVIYWGNGANGYGVVSLYADCEGSCPYPTEVYVPILPDTTVVTGDSVVCNYATSIYTVPYIPATVYNWCNPQFTGSCLPVVGVYGNQLVWDWGVTGGLLPQHNIFKVRVTYTNPFLGCSGYAELPVTLAGAFSIYGDTVICEGENDTLKSFAQDGTLENCNWTLYEQGTDIVVYTGSNLNTVVLSGLAAGVYRLSATTVDPYFCNNPSVISIRVVATPATPTGPILGPDTVCANSLVSYFTTAAAPGCYLEWEAAAGTPQTGVGQQFNTIWSGTLPSTLKLRNVYSAEPGCASGWLSQNIYAEPIDISGILGEDTVCANDTGTYSLSTVADRYTWSLADPTLGSVVSGQYSNTVLIQWNHYTGTPTVTQINVEIEKCGQVIDTVLDVLLKPYATATIQADTAPFCSGEVIRFEASTGSSYAWNFGDGSTTNTALDTVVHQYSDSGTYFAKVTVQDPYGCSSPAPIGITINILPGPVALLSTEDPINYCGQSTWSLDLNTTLQDVAGFTYTYALLHNGTTVVALGSASDFTINQTNYGTGTYRVLVSANGCTALTNGITISTTCVPTPCTPDGPLTFTIDDVDCGNVDVTASYSAPVTFTHFDFGDPGKAGNISTSNPATYTYKKAGHYTITATGDDGDDCPTGEQKTVTIPLAADFMVQYACSSNVMKVNLIDLSTFIGNDIDDWKWYIDGSPTYACNTQSCTPAISAGSHTIRLRIDNGGGEVCEITKTINVPATGTASFITIDSVCETEAVQFLSTSTGNIASYTWQHGDGTGSILQNTARDYVVAYNPLTPYWKIFTGSLTVTDIYGCSSTYTQDQLVYDDKLAGLTVDINPDAVIGCDGYTETTTVTMSSNPGTNPYSYIWSDGTNGTFSDDDFSYVLTVTGTYDVTISDKYGCVLFGGPITAYFEEINAAITGDTIYCKREPMNLSIFAGHDYTYSWLVKYPGLPLTYSYIPGVYPYLVNAPMNENISDGNVYDGAKFWGIVTSPNGCADTVGPVTVHQYAVVSSGISYGISPMPPCLNEGPVTLTLSSPNAQGFVWSNGVYGNVITFTSPGTYTLQMIDSNGCYKDPSDFKLPGGPDFSQLITGCYTRCLGQPTTLYGPFAPTGHTYTYQWLRNGNISIGTTQNVNVTTSGVYTLVISDTEGSFTCSDTSKTIDITFEPCPNAYCAEDTSISCISCFYDSASGARIMTVIINLNYTGLTETTYTVSSSTADVYAPVNMVGTPVEYIGNHVRPGMNSIQIDVADTSPYQTHHTIIVAIGDCYIPITLTTPEQCADND